MTKLDEYLYQRGDTYMIQLGYRLQSKDKDFILKVYNQCKNVDFQPSLVEHILDHYMKNKRKTMEYRIHDCKNNSQTLYVRGWYIKTAKPELIQELLEDYLDSINRDVWLDNHVPLNHKKSNTEDHIYYIKHTGKYRVVKYNPDIKRQVYYGEYSTIEEARKKRDKERQNGWKIPPRKRKPYKHDKRLYCIHQTKIGTYTIQKQGVHYGTYKRLTDAIEERDWLVENNWSYENIDLY